MTFTSDEQRREVAKKLRETCDEIERTGNGLTVWELTDILAIRDDDSGMIESLNLDDARNLADLIDRPTCRNLSLKPFDVLLCSECGEHVDIAYVENCDDYHAKYCPNCGAEVVE